MLLNIMFPSKFICTVYNVLIKVAIDRRGGSRLVGGEGESYVILLTNRGGGL